MNLDRIIAVRSTKTIYRNDDECVKVFNESYLKADVLNEALNQSKLEVTSLNVPSIKTVTTIDGKWAIISDFIQGKTLANLIKENPSKKAEYLLMFVDLQIAVFKEKAPLLNDLKEKMHRNINAANLDENVKYDLHTRLNSMPNHHKICHGDFYLDNIILTPDGKLYILDWSHVTLGNASADVARTYLLFWLNGDIDGANKYLDLYCSKTNTPKQYVKKWFPIVAASQLIKGNEKEREFLYTWINVVDYE